MKKYFRFSIRTLLVCMAATGLLLSFIWPLQDQHRRMLALDSHRDEVSFGTLWDYHRLEEPIGYARYDVEREPNAPQWLRNWFGENAFGDPVSIGIHYTHTTDEFLKDLAKIHELEELSLDDTKITDEQMAYFTHFPNLVELRLSNAKNITSRCADSIAGFRSLKKLHIDQTYFTDTGLARLKGLRHLAEVFAEGCKIDGTGFLDFQYPLEMKRIDLDSTLAPQSAQAFSRFENLETLRLCGKGIDDHWIEQLAPLTKLHWLGISDSEIDGTGFRSWSKVPSMIHFGIGSKKLSDEGVRIIMEKFPNVEHLNIGSAHITSDAVQAICKNEKLKTLGLAGAKIKDEDLKAVVEGCPNLEALIISSTNVTSEGIQHLTKLIHLDHLNVDGCPNLSDTSLELFTQIGLSEMRLTSKNFDQKRLEEFEKANPNLICWME